jgi:hypothetical protein
MISKKNINNCAIKFKKYKLSLHLIKLNNKCPAVILAANRTLNVIGRIKILKVSIKTINLIKTTGVPVGTRCLKFFCILLINPIKRIENQNGNP